MGTLRVSTKIVYCCECGLVLWKHQLPCYEKEPRVFKGYPITHMVNYCMRCGTEFTKIVEVDDEGKVHADY